MGFRNWLRNFFMPIRRWWFYRVMKMHTCTSCGADMEQRDNFCWDCGFDERKFNKDYEEYVLKQGPKPCFICEFKTTQLYYCYKDNCWVCKKCWDDYLKEGG